MYQKFRENMLGIFNFQTTTGNMFQKLAIGKINGEGDVFPFRRTVSVFYYKYLLFMYLRRVQRRINRRMNLVLSLSQSFF